MFLLIIIGTFPIGICGLFLKKKFIEEMQGTICYFGSSDNSCEVILFIAEKTGSMKKIFSYYGKTGSL